MEIYYGGCALSMLMAWLFTYTQYKNAKFAVCFSALPMFLLAALRYNVGTDYPNYVNIYKWAVMGVYYKADYAFNLILALMIDWGLDAQWLFVFMAAIFCLLVYCSIFKESPYPIISIFLLVGMTHYFAFLNIMRQMVGGAILLFSIRYIIERKFIPYFICVLLAFSIHSSCAIFFPFYWICMLNITPKIVGAILAGVFVVSGLIVDWLKSIILQTDYGWYLNSIYGQSEAGYIYSIIHIVILGFCSINYKKDRKYKTYYNIQIINVCVSFFSGHIALVERFRYMFGFPILILIPLVLENERYKVHRWILYGIIIVTFTIYSYLVTTSGNHGVLPYDSIL